MENASKALIIAGGILISMLVISIGVYLFANYGNASLSYDKNMETIEIQKFNGNFTKFEGRNNITIHEIITLANFAKQYKEETGKDINVCINNSRNLTELNELETIDAIKNNSTITQGGVKKVKYFKCNININTDIGYDEYGKVNSITFQNT